MQEKMKNEGLLSLLSTILKKSSELPEDVNFLVKSVKELANKLKDISEAVAIIAVTLQQHSVAIEELYSIQESLSRKSGSKSEDSKMPPLNKMKSEKPN